MADRWIQRWKVPSDSSDKVWIVAIDKDGKYGCSCPVWKFRRQECHHIKQVKLGYGKANATTNATQPKEKPKIVLATVRKPIYNEETNELYVPLIGVPDANMMEATICYYLLKYGYSMKEVREIRRHVPASWTISAINVHVEVHGEAEYPEGWYEH